MRTMDVSLRRVIELRERILATMTAEEVAEYNAGRAAQVPPRIPFPERARNSSVAE